MTTLADTLKSLARQLLPALSATLEKAEAHAAQSGYDPAVLLSARLYPDMLPLTSQVRIACDVSARGAARLAGREPPSFPDDETSIAELRARIAAALAALEAVDDAAMNANAEHAVTFPVGPTETLTWTGAHYVLGFVVPNMCFHVTTAYAILRHNGVPLGKRDFLMPPPPAPETA